MLVSRCLGGSGSGGQSSHLWLRSDGPAQAGRRGPDQSARPGLPQTPSGGALHPVIMTAPRGDVAGTRGTALVMRDRVIKVAPRCRPTADREPAVVVTHLDQVPHPVRDPVSGGRVRVGARDAGTAVRVIGVRVIGVRSANFAGRRCGSRQDGLQSGSQFGRRVRATLGDGRWLTQEHDRHRNGDPPEHACSGHPRFGPSRSGVPGSGHPRSGPVRISGELVCL